MNPNDEFFHAYPETLDYQWKENYYVNFFDRSTDVYGVCHFSFQRMDNKARFLGLHHIDGEPLMYVNWVENSNKLNKINDGVMSFEIVKPFEKFRLCFQGKDYQFDIDYEACFPAFSYKGPEDKDASIDFHHYEQPLVGKGKLKKSGKTREINCLGHRDHSWGYRDESQIQGWTWAAFWLADKFVNFSIVKSDKRTPSDGVIYTAAKNIPVKSANVTDKIFKENEPLSSIWTAVDENGKTWKFKSERLAVSKVIVGEKGETVFENFSEYTDLDSGIKGLGIEEHMINPNL